MRLVGIHKSQAEPDLFHFPLDLVLIEATLDAPPREAHQTGKYLSSRGSKFVPTANAAQI